MVEHRAALCAVRAAPNAGAIVAVSAWCEAGSGSGLLKICFSGISLSLSLSFDSDLFFLQ